MEFETVVRELIAFGEQHDRISPQPRNLCPSCKNTTMVIRNTLDDGKIKKCTVCGCFEKILILVNDDYWWDYATKRSERAVRRPVRTFREAVALFQGKGDGDSVPEFLRSDDTPKTMLKKLRKNNMRDRIDNIFWYRKVVCGEETYDLSSIEDDLIRVYEESGYKGDPWYLLYKLLKTRYGYKIGLVSFPNLTVNKTMKAEYDRCFLT